MRITMLVENCDYEKIQTPGEHIFHFIDATKKYWTDLFDGIRWLPRNHELIWKWVNQDHISLKKIRDFKFDPSENPHYLINFGSCGVYMPGVFGLIPEDTKEILRKYNIPILFFAPLEYINCVTQSFFSNLCDARDENGLENITIKLLALDTFYSSKEYKPLALDQIYSNLRNRNIKWVTSLGWVDIYNVNSIFHPGEYYNTLLNDQEISAEDHEMVDKPYLCLALNNKGRPNRQVLTFALHVFKNELSKILCSQNFKFENGQLPTGFIFENLNENNEHKFVLDKITVVNNLYNEKSKLFDSILELYLKDAPDGSLLKTSLLMYKTIINEDYPEPQFFNDGPDFFAERWDKDWYLSSWCSIVTETYEPRSIESPMVTEKTLKAILNYHPFYIFGSNFNNKLVAELGFRTFEKSWFNMPLEGTPGNNSMLERVHNLIQSLKYLSSLSQEELRAKYQSIKEDLEFNRNHLLKNDWGQLQNKFIMNPY